jgi:hypothetical protein
MEPVPINDRRSSEGQRIGSVVSVGPASLAQAAGSVRLIWIAGVPECTG